MPRRTVAVLGGLVKNLITTTNRIPDEGETITSKSFAMQEGGKGSNSAVAIHRLTRPNPNPKPRTPDSQLTTMEDTPTVISSPVIPDPEDEIEVRIIGAVGPDDFGHQVRTKLKACGVNVDGVRELATEKTAVSCIIVEAHTGLNRIMQFPGAAHAIPANDFMTAESLGGGVIPDLVVAQLEIRRESIEQAIETAYNAGIPVLLNPSPASYLFPGIYSMITHLVMNETEAVSLSEIQPADVKNQTGWTKVAEYFTDLGVKNVVITLGAKGAYYKNEYGAGHVDAEKNCTVVDTTGAGYSPSLICSKRFRH